MKKKIMMIGITGLTVMALTGIHGVQAAESKGISVGGVLEALFGEDGPLNDVLPEGTDIDAVIDTAKDKLSQAGGEISEVADTVAGVLEEKIGDLDLEKATEYISELIGQFAGDGDFGFGAMDEDFKIYSAIRGSEEACILEHNADALEQGDVQIVTNNRIYLDRFDADPIKALTCMIENTYRMDENNQLLIVDETEDIVLFTHSADADSGYPIAEAVFAGEGEEYMPSVEAMCDEVGVPIDEYTEVMSIKDAMVALELKNYLDEHPDIAGIEFAGEIRTVEELDVLWVELFPETSSQSEAMSAEEVMSVEETMPAEVMSVEDAA